MSKGNKEEQKWLLGESLNQYDRSLKEELGKVEKRNKEQNHKISALINAFDDDYIKKEEENTNISLDYSKEGIVIVDDIKGNTLVNNVKDSNKELVLNGDIDTQGVNVTLEDTVDNGKVDVVLEGNTEVNLSKTKDPIMITHKFDDINSNNGKLQTTVNGVTTVNDSPGKVDVKEIIGDTLVNHVSNGSEELILNGNIDTNGYSNVTLTEGVDGGKVDISLEGNTMVNVCDQEEPVAITKSYTVETGNHIALQGEYDGKCRPNIYGNTLVNLALAKDSYSYKNDIITNNEIRLTHNLKAGVTYTLIRTISEFSTGVIQEAITFYDMSFYTDGKQAQDHNCQYRGNGQYVSKFTPTKDVVRMDIIIGMDNIDKDNGIYPTITISDYMILEGDYTNKPIPDYFTGMKSSFEDKLIPENLLTTSNNGEHITITDTEYILGVDEGEYSILNISTSKTLEQGKTYTVYFNAINKIGTPTVACALYNNNTNLGDYGNCSEAKTLNNNLLVLNCTSECENLRIVQKVSKGNSISLSKKIYVVEGDYTNYDFTNYDSTKGGKYKVDYKVTGKNLFNFNKLNNTFYNVPNLNVVRDNDNQQYIISGSTERKYVIIGEYYDTNTFKHGKTYTAKNYDSNNDIIIQFVISYKHPVTGKDTYIVSKTGATTFTYDKSWGAIHVYCQIDNILDNISDFTIKFQIEEGDTATTYEPYKESIKTLYLNSPLLEGDTIEQSGNNIIHNHRYGKVVLDGSNYVPVVERILASTGNYRWIFLIPNLGDTNDSNISSGICDKYPIVTPTQTWTGVEGITQNNNGHKIVLYLDKYKDGSDASKQALINELSTNPITFIYKKSTPTQETISNNDNLLLDSYTNGHLDVDTVVPIDKVEFRHKGFENKYLNPNVDYIVQFEADNVGKIDYIILGGEHKLNINVTKGINKILCTSGEIENWLDIVGIGFNASKIVVTPKVDNDFGYFKGMKSVGECEGNKIEILSQNKNLLKLYDTKKSLSWNGITIKILNNNEILINGTTNTNYTWIELLYNFQIGTNPKTDKIIPLNKNFKYTLSANIISGTASDLSSILFAMQHKNTETAVSCNSSNNFSTTFGEADGAYRLWVFIKGNVTFNNCIISLQLEEGEIKTPYIINTQNKKEILLNEPLRGLPNGVKDKYVIIDGKWYIERNCIFYTFNGSENWYLQDKCTNPYLEIQLQKIKSKQSSIICDKLPVREDATDDMIAGERKNICGIQSTNTYKTIRVRVGDLSHTLEGSKIWLANNNVSVILELETPTYEPIDYNPFEVYTDITHISNNSTIPCNMVIKNSGFNTISLKENTKYTAYVNNKNNVSLTYKIDNNAIAVNSSNKFTFTTPSTLVDKTIRIASKGNKIENLMIIEGTPQNDPIGYFDGLKSSYECEKVTDVNDENFGKYKVDARVKGENFESTQTVYLNSPLLKGDKIIWKDNKLQHYHKMKTIVFDGHDGESWSIIDGEYAPSNTDYTIFYMENNCKLSSTVYCDKIPTSINKYITGSSPNSFAIGSHTTVKSIRICIEKSKLSSVDATGLKKWLQQNPITVVYELATPYYEEISEYPLKFSSIANCSLSTTSNIQVSNISFNIYEETLPYLYNTTKYYITFNSDISKEIIINLGGSELTYTTKVGFNKVEITTPSNSNNMLTFNGQGVNINNVKVTQQNIDSYFEGMKSVGECEDLEIVSNNKNLINNLIPYPFDITKGNIATGYDGVLLGVVKVKPNTKYIMSVTRDRKAGRVIAKMSNRIILPTELPKGIFDQSNVYNFLKQNYANGRNFEQSLTGQDYITFTTFNDCNYLYVNVDTAYNIENKGDKFTINNVQIEEIKDNSTTPTPYTPHKSNKQTMTHEPLRGLPNGVKDKYVIIDGKWYIERNINKLKVNNEKITQVGFGTDIEGYSKWLSADIECLVNNPSVWTYSDHNNFMCDKYLSNPEWNVKNNIFIERNTIGLVIPSIYNTENIHEHINSLNIIYQLKTPTYEPIDYNPFEVYTDTTHISNNSLIPANIVIRNTGYNCILKPNTKYTVVTNTQGSISAKIGSTKVDSTSNVFTIVTPSTLTDSILRFSGKGLTTKDIMLLEGDKTNYIPKYFTGMESAFEQEYDEEKNKYKVNVKVTDGNKENNITFYINEPLRGVGDVKDKVYVKEDKVVVERNCSSATFDGSEKDWGNGGYSNSKRIELYGYQISDMTGSYYSNILPCYRTGFQDIKSLYGININPNNFVSIFITRPSNIPNDTPSNIKYGRQWLQQNPTTVVYQLATPVYEEVECDLSKLMLENYENSSLILNSNIPPTVDVRYKGEAPIVSVTKELSSNVESTTTDINENIIPYMCDMDYRIVELQLKNASTQGLEVNVLGLDSEDVLFNNRKANKIFNPSYEMLKRDILSKRYSTDEYKYRLERYLLANKISNEEYNELEELTVKNKL